MSANVLCVDDEPEMLNLCTMMLENKSDFTLHGAETAGEAIDILASEEIDFLITDYKMPGVSPLEFLDKINELLDEMVPTLVFTGQSKEQLDFETLQEKGVVEIQTKSAGVDQYDTIIEIVNKHC